MRPIGIDLGTTYSVVATLDGDRVRVLPNAEGQRLTPSVVAFTRRGEALVGQAARLQAAVNPDHTIASVKRLMGSSRTVDLAGTTWAPEELAAFVLRKLKTDAEAALGERIGAAVVTVPAYFDHRQRLATREAARLAGLDVLRIINEPTAAALAYGLDREEAQTILVWDLGGGTFDVSLLELGDGIFEVRAVSGDSVLGGDDFDERLAARFASDVRSQLGAEAPDGASLRQRLRTAAEQAKIALSTESTADIALTVTQRSGDTAVLRLNIRRAEFEELTRDLLRRMELPCLRALADAGLTAAQLDRVLLVGGATRMPAVRRLARETLGREPYRWIDPDETVARGAAIQAGVELGHVGRVVLLDVLPLSLGVETQGGLVARIIPRNTPLPATEAHVFTTAADGQTAMDIHVVQGERTLADGNTSLGTLFLEGIPAAQRGIVKVEVAFTADVDGTVHVTAADLITESVVEARFIAGKQVGQAEAESLVREALWLTTAESERELRIRATVEADHCLAAAQAALQAFAAPGTVATAQAISERADAVAEALAAGDAPAVLLRCADLRKCLASLPPPPPAPARRTRRTRSLPASAAAGEGRTATTGAARA